MVYAVAYASKLALIAAGLALLAVAVFPPKVPYVVRKGSDLHETIFLLRIPAYAMHPAWQIRWSWRNGLWARAYCYDPEVSAAYRAAHNQ